MRILVTGSTGYIGAEIARSLLASGHELALLVRRQSLSQAKTLYADQIASKQAQIIAGDLTSSDSSENSHIGLLDAGVHLAALARFDGYSLGTFRQMNVQGSLNALELAASCGARTFFHFSTAFVCGDHPREFRETDADVGQSFRNDYERTKLESEIALRKRAEELGVTLTILRPSIVTGDGVTGRGRGLFGVIEILEWLRARMNQDEDSCRNFAPVLPGDPDARLNLVSLQAVVALFTRILDTPSMWGGCYHLVHPTYVRLSGIKASLEDLMDIHAVSLDGELCASRKASGEMSPLEKLFRRRINPYLPYFKASPCWICDELEKGIPEWREICRDARPEGLWGEQRHSSSGSNAENWIDDYFRVFIPSHLNDPAFREVRSLNDITAITVRGEASARFLARFRAGAFELLDEDAEHRPRCNFDLSAGTFAEIIGGRLAPQQAFFSKRVKIMGDVFFALKLGSLLEGFFLRNPYQIPSPKGLTYA